MFSEWEVGEKRSEQKISVEKLYEKIGQFKIENDFQEKALLRKERIQLIDEESAELSIGKKCGMLEAWSKIFK